MKPLFDLVAAGSEDKKISVEASDDEWGFESESDPIAHTAEKVALECQECGRRFKGSISPGREPKCPTCGSTDVELGKESRKTAAMDDSCLYCGRPIIFKENEGGWIDPNATGDDWIWRATCDSNEGDPYAPHEPERNRAAIEWQNRQGSKSFSRKTAAEGQTCSVCGDSIARDPEGEEPRTWHHTNGEKHDHEAKPGKEGSRRTAATCPRCKGQGETLLREQSGRKIYGFCPECGGSGEINKKKSAMRKQAASSYAWIITKDLLSRGDSYFTNEEGTVGPYNASDEQVAQLKAGKGKRFRMRDDDGIPYYEGRVVGDLDDGDPLSDFGMPNAGCTMYEEWEPGGGGGWKPVIGSKTAGRYCKTHQVWIGEGNEDNHDEACKIEEKKTESKKAIHFNEEGGLAEDCKHCGNTVTLQHDPTGQRDWAWAESNWGDDRDFQCGLSPDARHHPTSGLVGSEASRKTAANELECYSCGKKGDNDTFGMGNSRKCPECGSYEVHSPDAGKNWGKGKGKSEASLLQAMALAKSLKEQQALAVQLESLRTAKRAQLDQDRELDLANAVIHDHLTPVIAFARTSTDTDWMMENADISPEAHKKMLAEASLWFSRLSDEVKADRGEFTEQARGMARHAASRYAAASPDAERAFLDHALHLNGSSNKTERHRIAGTHDSCPNCGAPITFLPGDPDYITVFFQCPNEKCPFGKLSEAELAEAKSYQQSKRGAAETDTSTCPKCGTDCVADSKGYCECSACGFSGKAKKKAVRKRAFDKNQGISMYCGKCGHIEGANEFEIAADEVGRSDSMICPNCGSDDVYDYDDFADEEAADTADYNDYITGYGARKTANDQKNPPKCENCGKTISDWDGHSKLCGTCILEKGDKKKQGASYAGDPYWMKAKYPGRCAKCGGSFPAGMSVFYYPKSKTVYSGKCAEAASRDFASMSFDEDYMSGGYFSKRKTAMPNPADMGVKVGDIFYSSWGYDQTNVDFYEVTGLTGASVRVRPIASKDVETGGVARQWSGRAAPVPGEYIGPESIHRLSAGGWGKPAIKVDYRTYATLWDGQPLYYSTYATKKTVERKQAIKFGDLPDDAPDDWAGTFVGCDNPDCPEWVANGAEYSSNRHDYFMASDDEEMTCGACGEPMHLFSRNTNLNRLSRRTVADALNKQKCRSCGDPIERDPKGENPRTWHHSNGEKHDHEADPPGGGKHERYEDFRPQNKDGARKTASEMGQLFQHMQQQMPEIQKADKAKTLPCPQCGGEADYSMSYASWPSGYSEYHCPSCGFVLRVKPGTTRADMEKSGSRKTADVPDEDELMNGFNALYWGNWGVTLHDTVVCPACGRSMASNEEVVSAHVEIEHNGWSPPHSVSARKKTADAGWDRYVKEHEQDDPDAILRKTTPCAQCGKPMNPAEVMLGPVCGDCVRDNHRQVAGSSRKTATSFTYKGESYGTGMVGTGFPDSANCEVCGRAMGKGSGVANDFEEAYVSAWSEGGQQKAIDRWCGLDILRGKISRRKRMAGTEKDQAGHGETTLPIDIGVQEEVFDNFADERHPINQGVTEADTSSNRAQIIKEMGRVNCQHCSSQVWKAGSLWIGIDGVSTCRVGGKHEAVTKIAARPLHEIADEIQRDWKKVNFAAAPYLDAMRYLNDINDVYISESGRNIVHYFLGNASSWHGETAKRIKAELRQMVKNGSKTAEKFRVAQPPAHGGNKFVVQKQDANAGTWVDVGDPVDTREEAEKKLQERQSNPPKEGKTAGRYRATTEFWAPTDEEAALAAQSGKVAIQQETWPPPAWVAAHGIATGKVETTDLVSVRPMDQRIAVDEKEQAGQGASSLEDKEVGGSTDRPLAPWELEESGEASGSDAADVANVPTPGGERGYPQPKRGGSRKQAGDEYREWEIDRTTLGGGVTLTTYETSFGDTFRVRTWPCERCRAEVSASGGDDTECPKCGAQYNGLGQRLRDNWRSNPSNYDDEIGDLEGYEMSFHDSRKKVGEFDEEYEEYDEGPPGGWICDHDVPGGCNTCRALRNEEMMLDSMTDEERRDYLYEGMSFEEWFSSGAAAEWERRHDRGASKKGARKFTFKPGDRVRYSADFLRSTGQYTGEAPFKVWTVQAHPDCKLCASGVVVAVDEASSFEGVGPRHINAANLIPKGHVELANKRAGVERRPEDNTDEMWPWEIEGEGGGEGASDVADVPTPGGEAGYPKVKKGTRKAANLSAACGAWTHQDGTHAHEFCDGTVALPPPNDKCTCPCHTKSARRKTAAGRFSWLWPGTRKPDDMVAHVVSGGDPDELYAQGSRSIVRFNTKTGEGVANWKGNGPKYFPHLSPVMGAVPVVMSQEFIDMAMAAAYRSGDQIGPGVYMATHRQAGTTLDLTSPQTWDNVNTDELPDDTVDDPARPGGPAPYNDAEPFGLVHTQEQDATRPPHNPVEFPADKPPADRLAFFRQRVAQGLKNAGYYDDESDYYDPEDEEFYSDRFADPGGNSALYPATDDNPREYPCPNCDTPNVLTRADVNAGYQCDYCADMAEGLRPQY